MDTSRIKSGPPNPYDGSLKAECLKWSGWYLNQACKKHKYYFDHNTCVLFF